LQPDRFRQRQDRRGLGLQHMARLPPTNSQ
jgi:hypothetical protein